MKRILLFGVATLVFACAIQNVKAATVFYFTSSPASWIGQGQTLSLTDVSAYRQHNLGVATDSVHFDAGNYDYGLTIVGPGLTLPTVGFYPNATRWPFMGSGAGMAFTGPGRANNTLTGWFNVLQADYDVTGQVAAFAVDFLQYDEGIQTWWNTGSIRYNSSIPVPEPNAAFILVIGFATICIRRRDFIRR